MPEALVTPESWPVDIVYQRSTKHLTVTFDDGTITSHSATHLRVNSPSAEVQGHHPSEKRTIVGKENVTILRIDPVGNYAIRLVFDDGHDTGLYTWSYLRGLGV